jgi:two-component system alkaline phosphatase synthesis response regulator PhoP
MMSSVKARRTILVVDDDPLVRDMLEAVLGQAGFHLVTAADGSEALRAAAEDVPDVVLLDVMMPGMDGYAVCRAMRADARLTKTRIIMLTARGSREDRANAEAAGADAFFTKPFSPLDLIESVTAMPSGVGK